MERSAIAEHFRRHHGIASWTAITNQTIRDAFPDAVGVAVRGDQVAVIYAQCVECASPLCNHTKLAREETFAGEGVDLMILAHARFAGD